MLGCNEWHLLLDSAPHDFSKSRCNSVGFLYCLSKLMSKTMILMPPIYTEVILQCASSLSAGQILCNLLRNFGIALDCGFRLIRQSLTCSPAGWVFSCRSCCVVTILLKKQVLSYLEALIPQESQNPEWLEIQRRPGSWHRSRQYILTLKFWVSRGGGARCMNWKSRI